jgi:hypothetical protein
MPFKSQAQRRKFAQLLVEGKISAETFEEWNRETGAKKLPEQVKGRRQPARTRTASRTRRRRLVDAGHAQKWRRSLEPFPLYARLRDHSGFSEKKRFALALALVLR